MARSTETDTLAAVQTLLLPMVRLMLAHGLKLAQAHELLKAAFVAAAVEQRDAASNRAISAISVTTGLHRKEVKRLLASPPQPQKRGRLYAAEVFARWASDQLYLDSNGAPRALPRIAREGAAESASFESLTRSISTDVHPRSILEELKRLNLVIEDGNSVKRVANDYYPGTDKGEALSFLAANVGDHLTAAVSNVTTCGAPPFLEQAVFADELSAQSAHQASILAAQVWRGLLKTVTPKLQKMTNADASGPDRGWRVRIGLFAYTAAMPPNAAAPAKQVTRLAPPATDQQLPRKKTKLQQG